MNDRDLGDHQLPAPLARRFEAIVFDWDGTAVPDRRTDAGAIRAQVERLCGAGVDIAVVSGTHVGNIDGQLHARPSGPGRLLLALNRGSELFEVDENGPHLMIRRVATADEEAALTSAAEEVVVRLAARGVDARIVSQRLNRRKIDLLPMPEWSDPPKAVIDRVVAAVEQRLRAAGIRGLQEATQIALTAAGDVGLRDCRVTSDAKHLEIGLTDKADSARAVFAELWRDGIATDQVLIAGDEFGPLGGLRGSDSMMLVDDAARATIFSVGVEPEGLPDRVVSMPEGPPAFAAFLDDQLARRDDVPSPASEPTWSIIVEGFDARRERSRESLLAISDGAIGTTGAPLFSHPETRPNVVFAGIYDGIGPETELLSGPHWARLHGALLPEDRLQRTLHLRTGILRERVTGATTLESIRFVSLARPGIACLRASVEPADASPPLAAPRTSARASGTPPGDHGPDWFATIGTGGSITAAAAESREGPRVDRVVAYVADADGPRPEPARTVVRDAAGAGFNVLLAEHRREWGRRWSSADIAIKGDDELQHAIRVSLFHLIAAVGSEGESAVGARAERRRISGPCLLGRRRLRAAILRGDPSPGRACDARVPNPPASRRDRARPRRRTLRSTVPMGIGRNGHGGDTAVGRRRPGRGGADSHRHRRAAHRRRHRVVGVVLRRMDGRRGVPRRRRSPALDRDRGTGRPACESTVRAPHISTA